VAAILTLAALFACSRSRSTSGRRGQTRRLADSKTAPAWTAALTPGHRVIDPTEPSSTSAAAPGSSSTWASSTGGREPLLVTSAWARFQERPGRQRRCSGPTAPRSAAVCAGPDRAAALRAPRRTPPRAHQRRAETAGRSAMHAEATGGRPAVLVDDRRPLQVPGEDGEMAAARAYDVQVRRVALADRPTRWWLRLVAGGSVYGLLGTDANGRTGPGLAARGISSASPPRP
jgi:hypothetical protein